MADLGSTSGQRYYPSGGGGGGAAYTEGIQKSKRDTRTTDTTIPATALFVYIRNTAASGDITVNGVPFGPGDSWSQEEKTNEATSKVELCQEVVIESVGVEYTFIANYPSTTLVDVPNI